MFIFRLEEKLVDFDQMQAELHKSNALVEDLKAQIDSKNNLERYFNPLFQKRKEFFSEGKFPFWFCICFIHQHGQYFMLQNKRIKTWQTSQKIYRVAKF